MQKQFLLLFFLSLLAVQPATGQLNPLEIAGLKNELAAATSDTARVRIYNELAVGYRFSRIDSGLYFARLAYELSDSLNFTIGKIKALEMQGVILLEAGDIPQSLQCQLLGLSLLEGSPDTSHMASILNRIGNIYMELKQYPSAIKYYRQSEELYVKTGDTGSCKNERSNIGNIYELMGVLDSAKIYQQGVFDYSERHNDRVSIAYGEMRARMGNVEFRLGNTAAALDHYHHGIKESVTDFDIHNLVLNYIQMAKLFHSLPDYDSSYFYALRTIEAAKPISFKKAIYEASGLLADLFQRKKQPDSSLYYYKMSDTYKDSLYGPEIFQKLQLITLKEQERKQELIKENEALHNQYRMIASLSALFIIFLVAVFLGFSIRKQKRTNKKLHAQKQQIEEHAEQLVIEKKKSDDLLLNILPEEVADELKANGSAAAKHFEEVTVMFTDFKNFTKISENLSPTELVAEIDTYFKTFDKIISSHRIEKIKTIGDSYMCAGGLPVANTTNAGDVVAAAMQMQQFMRGYSRQRKEAGQEPFELRIGIHTGSVVAGIVGVKKFAYDIWGDTVNIASRMESSGEPGKVNISGSTYELIKDKFTCIHRGKIPAKNKGEIDMYFVEEGKGTTDFHDGHDKT
jgi:adenylate cyclase